MRKVRSKPLAVLLLLVVSARSGPARLEAEVVWSRDFFQVVPADLDGDEEDELVTMPTSTRLNVQDQRLYHLTGEWGFPPGTFEEQYLIGGSPVAGLWVTYVHNDSLFLQPETSQRAYFVAAGRDTARGWDGYAVQVDILDLDSDGKLEAVIAVGSGSGCAPRGIVVFDWETGSSLWHQWCGPNPYRLLYADLDSDGRTEILMSTTAPSNGNSDNGTDDGHTYVFLFDCAGQEIWRRGVGKASSRAEPAWLTDAEAGDTVLFVGEKGNPAWDRSCDSVFVLDPGTGSIVRSACYGDFNGDYAVLHDSAGQSLVAFWSSDELLLIDANLALVGHSRLPGTHDVQVAAGQFSGTGQDELAVLTGTGRLHVYDPGLRRLVDIPVGHNANLVPVRASGRTRLMLRTSFEDHVSCTLLDFSPVSLLDRGIPLGWSLAAGVLLLALFGVVLVAVRLRQTRDVRLLVRSLTGRAGVIELDRKGRVTRTNRKVRDILPRGSAASGNKTLPFEGPLAPLAGLVRAVLAEPTDASSREMPVSIGPDQTLLARTTRVKSGVLLTLEDISAVEYMRRVKAWLPVAQKLAHGIKNPLTTVLLTAQRIGKQADDEGTRSYAASIVREVGRLRRVSDSFMKLTRLEAPNKMPVNLNDILSTAVIKFREASSVNLKLNLDQSLPAVPADREQITTVFANVIENAVSAMPERGTLTVATSLETKDDDKSQVARIVIADTGKGIPERYLSKVFDPYFTLKEGGTGLGLVIVKRIVEDHGGGIRIDSQEDVGTFVTIELPVTDKRLA